MKHILMALVPILTLAGCAHPPVSQDIQAPGTISEDFLFNLREQLNQSFVDLDHDGHREMFVGDPETAGWLVLKRDGQGWRPMGEIYGEVRVLPPLDDGGIQFLCYHGQGGSDAFIATMTFRDNQFVVLDSEIVHAGDGGTEEGRRRLDELFGGSPEYPFSSTEHP